MKQLGKFTFADALDARFQSRGIRLAAGISTLVVSVFYLIPQMVGAGALVTPLLGFDQWVGVVMVGAVVILIVVTAGMVSTTWVQFLKGALLVVFSALLTWMILQRGLRVADGGADGHKFASLQITAEDFSNNDGQIGSLENMQVLAAADGWEKAKETFVRLQSGADITVWLARRVGDGDQADWLLTEAQTLTKTADGRRLVNGKPKGVRKGEPELHPVGYLKTLPGGVTETGPLSAGNFLKTLQDSTVVLWRSEKLLHADGSETTVYFQKPTPGGQVLRPGEHPTFKGIRSEKFTDKLNFVSLMLALFCGTASLPHILIRYYTVKDAASARRSTIVGIASIGVFYVLTLYLGLGAMTSGELDVSDENMSAPLLAKGMNTWLFAAISAIAFTTVLGTVSGLILAAAGAVTHDLLGSVFRLQMSDTEKVRTAKISSVVVGAAAIALGILFQKMNPTFLVGWAFSVAASANLPSLIMILFWPRVTKQGIVAAVVVGMLSSMAWILLSSEAYSRVYGLDAAQAVVPFSQPGIITIPLGFLTLVAVSLITKPAPVSSAD
jgi:cation/acetate symporter